MQADHHAMNITYVACLLERANAPHCALGSPKSTRHRRDLECDFGYPRVTGPEPELVASVYVRSKKLMSSRITT
jgi:hypothetical protein